MVCSRISSILLSNLKYKELDLSSVCQVSKLKYSVFKIMAHTHHMEANRNIKIISLCQQVFKLERLSSFRNKL